MPRSQDALIPRGAARRTWSGASAPSRPPTSPSATSRWSPTAARCRGTTRSRKRSISSSKAPAKCASARSASTVHAGQAVYIPHKVFHQLTNIGDTPLRMLYCYGPAGDVAHWRQELDGTLPKAGIDVPALPAGRPPAVHGETESLTHTIHERKNHPLRRHHHERRHRTHGAEPAPAPLDLRHHPAGRRQAERQRESSCRSRFWWAAIPPSSRPSAPSAAAFPGPPISTRPSPTRTTPIYFDSQTTDRRAADVKKAIAAGKHIYCEKPVADSLDVALELLALAEKAGVKHGVVQDKLWLPGMLKLQDPDGPGLLRPHLQRARRIRLLGLRRRHGAHPAALVELPQGRRRRHHHRHALPLALRARQPLRTGEGRLLPAARPTSPPAGTKPASPTTAPPTIRPTPPSTSQARTAASWRTSIRPGPCACAATTC